MKKSSFIPSLWIPRKDWEDMVDKRRDGPGIAARQQTSVRRRNKPITLATSAANWSDDSDGD